MKRTFRHLFSRQHRGGIGVYDIDLSSEDLPECISVHGENDTLLLASNKARVFRFPIKLIDPSPVRGKGSAFFERLGFESDEMIVGVTSEKATGYLAFVTTKGFVRLLRHHLFGEHMKQGTVALSVKEHGDLAGVCWAQGADDLFILSKNGVAIRFPEKNIPPQGILGLKLAQNDECVSVTSVNEDSSVVLIGADGKGTIRLMSGFTANKSPGGSGKLAIKTNRAVSGLRVEIADDIFIITNSSKIIRFPTSEIPPTAGVIQGVNCIAMRNDQVAAVALCRL